MNTNNLKKMRGAIDPLTLGLVISAMTALIGANITTTTHQPETQLHNASLIQTAQPAASPCQAHCKLPKQ